ncbi:MAG TPA: NUDIX domain-containing protein [Rhizomicrobium sp.]|nr:NUDIX domain-containing protein [Rhizomicrobium sp.]
MPAFSRLRLALVLAVKALRTPVAFGASAVVEDGAGRVLLVRHSYMEGWHFPGGGVEGGEPAAHAVIRELREEVGLVRSAPPEFLGLFTRKVGWATNVIALYRVREAVLDFRPNLEIREIQFADPAAPPPGTTPGVRRRLAELVAGTSHPHHW